MSIQPSARGAGVRRDGVQLLLALAQVFGQRTQARRTLLEVQLQQLGPADLRAWSTASAKSRLRHAWPPPGGR
jgi:hypothetical protein